MRKEMREASSEEREARMRDCVVELESAEGWILGVKRPDETYGVFVYGSGLELVIMFEYIYKDLKELTKKLEEAK